MVGEKGSNVRKALSKQKPVRWALPSPGQQQAGGSGAGRTAHTNLPTRDAVTEGSTGSPGAPEAALLSARARASAPTALLARASPSAPVMGRDVSPPGRAL